MSARLRDWQSRLAICLAQRTRRSFVWGGQDCCLYAADCVEAVTGVDPAADLRGAYDSSFSAQRVLNELGGIEAIAAARCGPECAVPLAQVGDIGVAELDGRQSLVVCGGAVWFGPGPWKVESIQPGLVRRAWRCC